MKPEPSSSLNPSVMVVGVGFPNKPLPSEMYRELFSAIAGRYSDFNSFAPALGNGVRIADQTGNQVIVTENLIQMQENVQSIVLSKQRVLEILKDIVLPRVSASPLVGFGVKFVCRYSSGDNTSAVELLKSNLFSLTTSDFSILGPELRGIGSRFVINRQNITYELKVESLLADASQFYIELDVQFREPFTDANLIEQKIETAHNFLKNEVKNFLVTAGAKA